MSGVAYGEGLTIKWHLFRDVQDSIIRRNHVFGKPSISTNNTMHSLIETISSTCLPAKIRNVPFTASTVPAGILEEVNTDLVTNFPVSFHVWTEGSDVACGLVRSNEGKFGVERAFVDHVVGVAEAGCDEADEYFARSWDGDGDIVLKMVVLLELF